MNALTFTHYLSSMIDPACQAIIHQLQVKLSLPVNVIEGDWAKRMIAIDGRQPQVAWVCGLLHVVKGQQGGWSYQPIAAPVMKNGRYAHKPVYFTDLIVHADSELETFADLAGKRWGINEALSFSGFHMLKCWMRQNGVDEPFFGQPILTGTHLHSIVAVQNCTADFATIDSTVIDMLRCQTPQYLQNIRVIQSIGPFPAPPILISNQLPDEFKERLSAILLNLHLQEESQPLLQQIDLAAFAIVDDSTYDDIRQLPIQLD